MIVFLRHCEERSDEAIPTTSWPGLTRPSILLEKILAKKMDTRVKPAYDASAAGLLRGACHRASLCADPLARNDEQLVRAVL
jgi:hypothetical protein